MQGGPGWEALTDLVSNLLGILIMMSMAALFFQIIARQEEPLSVESTSGLPLMHVFVTDRGVFPITSAAVLEPLMSVATRDDPEALARSAQVSVASAYGAVDVEFRADASGPGYCILMQPRGSGCTAGEALKGDCPGLSGPVVNTPGRHLLFFHVYPGGFKAFEALCPELALLGHETAWKPRTIGERSFLCFAERTWSEKQGVTGGRAVASQSCLWLLERR